MAAAYARGDHRADPPPARRERLRVPGRRLRGGHDPARRRLVRQRRGARRDDPGPRAPVRPRAPGRDRGGDRARRVAAPAATSRSGRARPPCARAWRRSSSPRSRGVAWDWYRSSSFISCPVRTAGGRTLGVLAISSRAPQRLLGAEELRVVEVFAGLAALALERSELLDREERRGREERELNEAARAVSASLELDAVYAAIVEQARQLVGRGQGRAAPLRAGDGRPAHRRGDRLHRGGRAHALPRRRGHDRPGRAHRGSPT